MNQNLQRSPLRAIQGVQDQPNRVIPPVSVGEILAEALPTYQVRGILSCGAVHVVFGDSQSGKTFLMLDLAACVATGTQFAGRKTRQGSVLYVSAEGNGGLGKRLRALVQKYPGLPAAPLRVVRQPVDLIEMVEDLEIRARDLQDDQGKLGLVVLDTLSQTIGGRDENGPDMAAYVSAATKIAASLGAPVVINHHLGKDVTRGARGNSSLRGNVDAMFRITNVDGQRGMAAEKMRDGELEAMGFALRVLPVGRDSDGEEQTSCVIDWTGAAPVPGRKPISGAAQKLLFQLAGDLAKSAGGRGELRAGRPIFTLEALQASWAATKAATQQPKQAAPSYCRRALHALIEGGHLQAEGGELWFP